MSFMLMLTHTILGLSILLFIFSYTITYGCKKIQDLVSKNIFVTDDFICVIIIKAVTEYDCKNDFNNKISKGTIIMGIFTGMFIIEYLINHSYFILGISGIITAIGTIYFTEKMKKILIKIKPHLNKFTTNLPIY